MSRALWIVVLGAQVAVADVPPPTVPRGVQLVTIDTAWRYQVVTAPALAPQIGALAVSGLDIIAGRASEPTSVLGTEQKPPAAWPYDVDTPTLATGKLAPRA